MTEVPTPQSQNSHHNQHGMTHLPPYAKHGMTAPAQHQGMTYVPPEYQQKEKQQGIVEKKPNFLMRFFAHWDLRQIEGELQMIRAARTDLNETMFQKTEFGYFEFGFSLISVTMVMILGFVLTILTYFIVSLYLGSTTLGFVIAFILLQMGIFGNAAIVYRLHRHKIGEKETGRYIKIVRNMWHTIETIILSFTAVIMVLYVLFISKVDWNSINNAVQHFNPENKLAAIAWRFVNKLHILPDFSNLKNIIAVFIILMMVFILMYIIGIMIVYKKATKEQKNTMYKLRKEYKNPADLAREIMSFKN